ncbi:BTB-domain-containing protein [Sistotremastrum niveocremeum HHB9708]|uniref:BTB-domain-containing protein n=1 Tax=Sistotremastrum niveocremeum HHB9708 TaxID=1314777 RepID=A0A164SYD6_9AGAM|nr:BTB-domain-containing protein [Sistotremastrum niveocremeum HHB9708]
MSAMEEISLNADNATHATRSQLFYSDGDFIIRASDGVDFKVHKIVMSLASQVFRDMLSLDKINTLTATSEIPIPVVDVFESSQVFESILQFIYPISPPDLSSFDKVIDLLSVADKYMMPSVMRQLEEHLLQKSFEPLDGLRFHALARRFSLSRLEAATMKHVVCLDITVVHPHNIPPEANWLTLQDYNRFKFFADLRLRKCHVLFGEFIEARSSLYDCTCIRRQRRSYLMMRKVEDGPHWDGDDDSSADEDYFDDIECEVWAHFFELCRKALRKNLQANVLEDVSIRYEAKQQYHKCRGINDDFIRDSSEQLKPLKKQMDELPWAYEQEYALARQSKPAEGWKPTREWNYY